jgi:hypothetical protein
MVRIRSPARHLPLSERLRARSARPSRNKACAACSAFCNSPQMNAPEAYIQFTPGLITDGGEVTVPATEDFLRDHMAKFHAFRRPRVDGPAARRVEVALGRPTAEALGET